MSNSVEVGYIIDRINTLVAPPKEIYEKMLDFSRELSAQNTAYIFQQKELHKLLIEEIIPGINLQIQNQGELSKEIAEIYELVEKLKVLNIAKTSSVIDHATELFDKDDINAKKTVIDINKLLHDEDYNLMKKIKTMTFWIKFISALWIIFGIVATIYGVKYVH